MEPVRLRELQFCIEKVIGVQFTSTAPALLFMVTFGMQTHYGVSYANELVITPTLSPASHSVSIVLLTLAELSVAWEPATTLAQVGFDASLGFAQSSS